MDVTLPDGTVINGVPDGTSKADLVAKLSAKGHDVSWYKPEPTAPKERSLPESIGRQLGLTARYGLEGVASLPAALGNVMEKVGVPRAGGNLGTTAANYLGLPKPEGDAEKVISDITQTLVPGGAAFKGASTTANALTKAPGFVRAALTNVGGGAAAGAASNAALDQDIGEGAALGAAMGPAGALIGKGAGFVGRTVGGLFKNPEEIAGKYLRSFTNDTTRDAAVLRALRGEVSGEAPTSGMAAVADPRLQYLKELEERARRTSTGGGFLLRDQENQAAREAILQPGASSVTRYPGEGLSEVEALRQRVSSPLYSRANADRVALNPELEQRVAMAEANRAVNAGDRTFAQGQMNDAAAGRPVQQGASAAQTQPVIRDASTGATMAEAGPFMPQPATRSIDNLQKIRFEIDSELNSLGKTTDSAGQARFRELKNFRDQLTSEMRGQSGNFSTADTIFKNYSQPVNQGNIDKVLLNALRSPSGNQRNDAFLSAMENAPRTIDRANIPVGGEHLESLVSPEHMAQINTLRRSVQKEAEYAAVPRMSLPGMQPVAGEIESDMPGLLSQKLTIAKKAISKLTGGKDEKAIQLLNDAALDPTKMATLLEKIPPAERESVLAALRTQSRGAPLGALTGTIIPNRKE